MDAVTLPVSYGEAADKISILLIKKGRMADPAKRANVVAELDAVSSVFYSVFERNAAFDALFDDLRVVNEKLWDIEDQIRQCERESDFGKRFIELARSVYFQNDRRARIKREINTLLGSTLVEEKSYTDYAGSDGQVQESAMK